jgi:hypothetical protein
MNLHIYNINLNLNINVSGEQVAKIKTDSPTELMQGTKRAQTNSPDKPADDAGLDPFEMVS